MLSSRELEQIKQATSQNNPEAQFKLAMHYKNEPARPGYSEPFKILDLLVKAAKQKHALAAKELLDMLLIQSKDRRNIDHLRILFEAVQYCIDANVEFADDAVSYIATYLDSYPRDFQTKHYLKLARLYKYKNNIPACIAILEKEQSHRDPDVTNMLGDLYYNGKMFEKAFVVFKQACTVWQLSANAYTYYSYAWMLHRGYGIAKPNIDVAIQYYKNSLPEQIDANFQLGSIYYASYIEKFNKKERDYNYPEYKALAIQHFSATHANKTKAGEAFNYIGLIYFNDGNFIDAERYFLKAIEMDSVPAKYNLAHIYSSDKLGAEKKARALDLYKEAATAGNPDAQYKLYEFYAHGTGGCDQDKLAAFLMLVKAVQQNYPAAVQIMVDPNTIFRHIFLSYKYIMDNITDSADEAIKELAAFLELEKKLQYQFENITLAYQALDRNIDQTTKEAKYQQLEFIGDGVLNAAIRLLIHPRLPASANTHKFNEVYNILIQNKTVLPRVAEYLNIKALINLDDTESEHDITEQMLADGLEALIGAITVDSKSMDTAYKTVNALWEPHLKAALAPPAPVMVAPPAAPVVTFHRRKLSETSIRLQQTLTGVDTDELTTLLREKTQRAGILTKQGDTLLHLLAKQTVQLADSPAKMQLCVDKINTLIQFGGSLDIKNKQSQTARELLSYCPQIKLQGDMIQHNI